eukprot:GFYU01012561.1.p1 GENE.GFYU01012561.1~~GFYU01012561.1.p1  ORF type:complete len:149 (-),score=29.09 GFYU01012561.1:72-518(-)
MAPELMVGTHMCITTAVDIYAFGIVMWQVFTRDTLYPGINSYEIPRAVADGTRPHISEDFPEWLRILCDWCWQGDRTQRPTWTDILDLLRDHHPTMGHRRTQAAPADAEPQVSGSSACAGLENEMTPYNDTVTPEHKDETSDIEVIPE